MQSVIKFEEDIYEEEKVEIRVFIHSTDVNCWFGYWL